MNHKNSKLWMKMGIVMAVLGSVLVSGCIEETVPIHFYIFNLKDSAAKVEIKIDNTTIFSEDFEKPYKTPQYIEKDINITKGSYVIAAYEKTEGIDKSETIIISEELYVTIAFYKDKIIINVKQNKPIFE